MCGIAIRDLNHCSYKAVGQILTSGFKLVIVLVLLKKVYVFRMIPSTMF
jgi:hypothetical protein